MNVPEHDTYRPHNHDAGYCGVQGKAAYRIFEVIQDLKELIEALGHSKCILVAHDWGAVAAWRFAAYHPVGTAAVGSLQHQLQRKLIPV